MLCEGIYLSKGQSFMGSDYDNQAIRYVNANLITSGPLFTVNSTGQPQKLIGFGISSRANENLASSLAGVKACFVNGIFRIEIPECLPSFKARVAFGLLNGQLSRKSFMNAYIKSTLMSISAASTALNAYDEINLLGFKESSGRIAYVFSSLAEFAVASGKYGPQVHELQF